MILQYLVNIARKVLRITLVLASIPLVLIMRLISLIYPVKLVRIRASPLGHFVYDTEYHLRKYQLFINNCRYLCFFDNRITNSYWAELVRRNYVVHSGFGYMWRANRLIPRGWKYEYDLVDGRGEERDKYGVLSRTELQLKPNKKEEKKGLYSLRKIGLSEEDKFVCLIARDAAYKEGLNDKRDWSYHSYRDIDINSFAMAATSLADKGYWVFRMGKVVKSEFNVIHPRVVDYANSEFRSDFMDVWLMQNCCFCITTGTGLDEISGVAKIPSLFVNLLPFNHATFFKNSITVPKKLVWKTDKRMLTLREYMNNGYDTTTEYQEAGIEIVDLDKREIESAVLEMERVYIDGYVADSPNQILQEIALQKIFDYDKHQAKRNHYFRDNNARIGSSFLNTYWDQLMADEG